MVKNEKKLTKQILLTLELDQILGEKKSGLVSFFIAHPLTKIQLG